MSEPRRAGLMELLMSSTGCQFVIPVYQRNYTWRADQEVKQFLSDLKHVLCNDYKNHFLGILIYLEKSIDFSTRELSIIDGQQRLTTTFLTIYAVKEMFKKNGETDKVEQLEGQYLTNPFHKDKIKYKLKPLVSDDDVYRCIVEDRIIDIENTESTVLKNYNYIKTFLEGIVLEGFSANDILLALNKLYVVCVPISEEDNAQKIFESINATGVKLTAADLIRNFLLMNLQSDKQDLFYANYWKKIEDNVSSDSKILEMFFRMYLAIKTYVLVPKNSVYRSFVDWVNNEKITTDNLFKELLTYAKILNQVNYVDIASVSKDFNKQISDFRKVNSDVPLSLVIECYRLYQDSFICASTLARIIDSVNAFMIRRSICDMDSQNISKLFPSTLKKVIDKCAGDYANIVEVLNQEMVGNNSGTSGSFMPTDAQMHDYLINANVYKRPALRIVLDRMELTDNPAPVDLSVLSVEHLMPQTPTDEWFAELDIDEETYFSNLHRLGNLTLATKPDNSKMGNNVWEYKNEILADTAHLKMNMELLSIAKWDIDQINLRTERLIGKICEIYPYPKVSMSSLGDSYIVDEKTAGDRTVHYLFDKTECIEVKKNNTYYANNGQDGYILFSSKMTYEGDKERYWFGYRLSRLEKINDCPNKYCVFICRGEKTSIVKMPASILEGYVNSLNHTDYEDGSINYYHVFLFKGTDGKINMLLSKPSPKRIDVTTYLIAEI